MRNKAREIAAHDVIIEEEALLDFQEAIIVAMKDMGITQSELADRLGISRGRMSQILSSEANPTIKLVGRITHALALEARYMKKAAPKQAAAHVPVFDLVNLSASLCTSSSGRTPSVGWVINSLPVTGGQWHNNDNTHPRNNGKKALAA